ncbi:major capsid pentamer protein [Mycobacterium phage Phelemich]|uniref:Uncharacterized protein n=2 Tax=Acadianvirus reprobate TaxID=1982903 RepID=S5YQV5_9CAUD|nr:hypothetical protein N847_gp14 [Mycobacterium phage Phelemich]YP_008409935.1 hypothetical protein REPROBATE_14 [Mycobacterium phage Reprobate]AGT12750.1 major capsid pentamer protein [Mycobacterium phage Reprobate]AGT13928.1 major capsid pentamer protein [Mycobacterium phage Phelemich]
MTAPVLLPLQFEPPLQNPSPYGLFAATAWQVPAEVGDSTEGDAVRHLNGVDFRPVGNYGGEGQSGIWPNDSCATGTEPTPGLIKEGLRAAGLPTFDPIVVWAYDECDLTEPSRAEVRERAAQVLRLEEQVDVERELAARMLADAGVISQTAVTLAQAIGYLEAQLALTSTLGFIHIGAQWVAQDMDLFLKAGTAYKSPLGHTYVIGGGYVDGLENSIVATSPVYGWRDEPTIREAIEERHNTFVAVAERTVLVGYEHLVAAVTIDTTP